MTTEIRLTPIPTVDWRATSEREEVELVCHECDVNLHIEGDHLFGLAAHVDVWHRQEHENRHQQAIDVIARDLIAADYWRRETGDGLGSVSDDDWRAINRRCGQIVHSLEPRADDVQAAIDHLTWGGGDDDA